MPTQTPLHDRSTQPLQQPIEPQLIEPQPIEPQPLPSLTELNTTDSDNSPPQPKRKGLQVHMILAILVLVPASLMGLGMGLLYLIAWMIGPIACGGAPNGVAPNMDEPAPTTQPAPTQSIKKPAQPAR